MHVFLYRTGLQREKIFFALYERKQRKRQETCMDEIKLLHNILRVITSY